MEGIFGEAVFEEVQQGGVFGPHLSLSLGKIR